MLSCVCPPFLFCTITSIAIREINSHVPAGLHLSEGLMRWPSAETVGIASLAAVGLNKTTLKSVAGYAMAGLKKPPQVHGLKIEAWRYMIRFDLMLCKLTGHLAN